MKAPDLILGAPMPRWFLPTMATVVAIVTWLSARSPLGGPYVTWSAVSQQWHETVWFAGVAVVIGSAAISSQAPMRGSVLAPSLRPRGGTAAAAALALACGLWAMLGHALGMVPALVRGLATASWGQPAWLEIAIGSGGVLVLGVMGSCAGQLVGHWLVAPVAGVVAGSILALPRLPSMRPWALLQPVQQWEASVRFVMTPATAMFTLIAMLAGGLAAVWITGWLRSGRRRLLLGDSMVLAAPLLLTVMAFVWRPEFYHVDDQVPEVCREASGTPVCLHRAHAATMDDATRATRRLERAGLAPLLERVTDRTVSESTTPRPGEVLLKLRLQAPVEGALAPTLRQQIAVQVVNTVVLDRCLGRAGEREAHEWSTAQVLARTYFRNAGFGGLADRAGGASVDSTPLTSWISKASEDELRAWTAQNRDVITSCDYPREP